MNHRAPRSQAQAMESRFLEILRGALRLEELLDDDAFAGRDGDHFLERWFCRIQDLWNYTPRGDFGGKRPAEKLHEESSISNSRIMVYGLGVLGVASFDLKSERGGGPADSADEA